MNERFTNVPNHQIKVGDKVCLLSIHRNRHYLEGPFTVLEDHKCGHGHNYLLEGFRAPTHYLKLIPLNTMIEFVKGNIT